MERSNDVNSRAKILVTGAFGLSGSLVIKEFIRQGIPVKALVRNRENARGFEGHPILSQPGHEKKFYEMTGPDAMTMYEASEIISNVIGKKISYMPIGCIEYHELLTKLGISPAGIEILTQLSKGRMKCTESYVKLDTHKRLGIRPTSFAEFMYKYISAFN